MKRERSRARDGRGRFRWTDRKIEILRTLAPFSTAGEIAQKVGAPDVRTVYRGAAIYGVELPSNKRGGPSVLVELTARQAYILDEAARLRNVDRSELCRLVLAAVADGGIINAVLDDRGAVEVGS